jgi:uncharacterized Fe-S cluster protein YjdI
LSSSQFSDKIKASGSRPWRKPDASDQEKNARVAAVSAQTGRLKSVKLRREKT